MAGLKLLSPSWVNTITMVPWRSTFSSCESSLINAEVELPKLKTIGKPEVAVPDN